ncbi:hypothetical protein FHG87_010800 [Trinorchestia longiramus]|nr:hypothetical protein FHG87_010800 [Trinorchestia longiramus]
MPSSTAPPGHHLKNTTENLNGSCSSEYCKRKHDHLGTNDAPTAGSNGKTVPRIVFSTMKASIGGKNAANTAHQPSVSSSSVVSSSLSSEPISPSLSTSLSSSTSSISCTPAFSSSLVSPLPTSCDSSQNRSSNSTSLSSSAASVKQEVERKTIQPCNGVSTSDENGSVLYYRSTTVVESVLPSIPSTQPCSSAGASASHSNLLNIGGGDLKSSHKAAGVEGSIPITNFSVTAIDSFGAPETKDLNGTGMNAAVSITDSTSIRSARKDTTSINVTDSGVAEKVNISPHASETGRINELCQESATVNESKTMPLTTVPSLKQPSVSIETCVTAVPSPVSQSMDVSAVSSKAVLEQNPKLHSDKQDILKVKPPECVLDENETVQSQSQPKNSDSSKSLSVPVLETSSKSCLNSHSKMIESSSSLLENSQPHLLNHWSVSNQVSQPIHANKSSDSPDDQQPDVSKNISTKKDDLSNIPHDAAITSASNSPRVANLSKTISDSESEQKHAPSERSSPTLSADSVLSSSSSTTPSLSPTSSPRLSPTPSTMTCAVHYINDIDPFAFASNLLLPPLPMLFTFATDRPLSDHLHALHRQLDVPQNLDDACLQVYREGDYSTYLDLDTPLAQQTEDIDNITDRHAQCKRTGTHSSTHNLRSYGLLGLNSYVWNEGLNSYIWNEGLNSYVWNEGLNSYVWNEGLNSYVWNEGLNSSGWNEGLNSSGWNEGLNSSGWNEGLNSYVWNEGLNSYVWNEGLNSYVWNEGLNSYVWNEGLNSYVWNEG